MTLVGRGLTSAPREHAGKLGGPAPPVPGLLLLAWGAMFVNVLTPSSHATVLPVPHAALQAVAQGSLVLALLFALLVNPRVVVRPDLFLVLLAGMAVVALMVSIQSDYLLGSTYRAVRLIVFVACLWLLSPWWGRREMPLLRAHRLCLWAAVGSVLLGAALAPGKAFSFEGRLAGALWPIPPTQVAHYAAVLFGTSVILWMCRVIGGRHALFAVLATGAVLIGTHTRTALTGVVLGLAIASGSLFLGHSRVRRAWATTLVAGVIVAALFAPQVVTWLARGQSAEDAAQLTGRTKVWSAAVEEPRSLASRLFGDGLSNKSFDGLPVDSNWVSAYLDLGWLGVVLQVALLLILLLRAASYPRGVRRAVALFLILYCMVASVTEVGPTDASVYILDLAVASSLVAAPPHAGRRSG